jgi:hypothetical protein
MRAFLKRAASCPTGYFTVIPLYEIEKSGFLPMV